MLKYFTVEEANAALKYIAPVAQDIVRLLNEAQKIHDEVHRARTARTRDETELLGRVAHAENILKKVEYHAQELESVGVILKDTIRGLIDFPSQMQGRDIFLCWALGEKKISTWHELNHGIEDRKPLPEAVTI